MTHASTSQGGSLASPMIHENIPVFIGKGDAPVNIQVSGVISHYSEGIIGFLLGSSLKTINPDFINDVRIAEDISSDPLPTAYREILQA